MKEKEIIDELKMEGYSEVYLREDSAGFVYDSHEHEYQTKLVIVSGNIEIEVDNNKINLSSGNSFIIPAWKRHCAKVGKEGCKYVVGEGEKIK